MNDIVYNIALTYMGKIRFWTHQRYLITCPNGQALCLLWCFRRKWTVLQQNRTVADIDVETAASHVSACVNISHNGLCEKMQPHNLFSGFTWVQHYNW